MFDAITSQLLQSAPSLPGLDSGQLPQLLTRHYAELVSARLKGDMDNVLPEGQWSLERIADAYEIIASIEEKPALRRAAAFVAGTAQQIISRRLDEPDDDNILLPIDRDGVNASAAAAILFLVAEQYADANEASFAIPADRGPREIKALGKHIKDLASGHLNSILQRANRWRQQEPTRGSIQMRALRLLAATISEGIELLAADMMSAEVPEATPKRFENAQEAFRRVINMSTHVEADTEDVFGGRLRTAYAGPAHLASLLLSAADKIEQSALTKLSPPNGADVMFWKKWLRFRAVEMPFIWPNHREAIEKNFYQTGTSAVLVLPTGAGKTTISALKIAGTLARGMKVIFLAPTHALVEQLTEDLQAIFPQDMFGSEVSSDFDSLLLDDAQLQDIEVMTPERCLAMLSFSASSFQNVGLLVFDECHLLSPQSQKIGRALDGMLCLLAFRAAAEADMLFLSAMLKNGPQFAEWIADLTGRPCQSIDLLWKPSRQARGVVVYEDTEVNASINRAKEKQRELNVKKGKRAKTLRTEAEREITATPYVVWGLQHNWISVPNSYALTSIANTPMQLAGGFRNGDIWPNPNANKIAVRIAVSAKSSSLKTIVFVNTKADAIRCARFIARELEQTVVLNESEQAIWNALAVELRETDFENGYPVFSLVSLHSAAKRGPKNLIFASPDKPDLRFKDALDNDIEIVTNTDKVLVYDRPIGNEGLHWSDLQQWWGETKQITDDTKAKHSLYRRLKACLPHNSPPQALLFEAFFEGFHHAVPSLPALLPEVWLHWDPRTIKERGRDALLRFRMDFLLLLPHGVRVVIEVDGKHHYADDAGYADVQRYAQMVQADRELKLSGYEVFRFGAAELQVPTAKADIKAFFDGLFKRYSVPIS